MRGDEIKMIGNNDWLDYLDLRNYLAHSFKGTTWSDKKYIDKVPVGGGKYRYIYPGDSRPGQAKARNSRSVPTYFDRNQRATERRNAERASASNRASSNSRIDAERRVRGQESARRSAESNALNNRYQTDQNIYNRQQRAMVDAQRRAADQQANQGRMANNQQIESRNLARGYANQQRAAEQQIAQNRMTSDAAMGQRQQRAMIDAQRRAADQQANQERMANNQEIESRNLARGYANQQRAAEQQIAQNRMTSDAAMAQRQQRARADAERRDAESKAAEGRAQNEQQVAENKRPKNLFDQMGNALNSAGNWFGDRARDVGNAVDAAGDWVGDRARDVSNAVGGAVNAAGDWVGDRARDVGNAASGAWNQATGGDGRLDWEDVTRAAQPVTNAANAAGNWVGDRARDVGNAVGGAVNAAGDWVDRNITGQSAKQEMDNKRQELTSKMEQERNLMAEGYRAMANNDRARAEEIARELYGPGSYNDVKNEYNESRDNYGKSLFGRIGNAVDAAGNWVDSNITGNSARQYADYQDSVAQENRNKEHYLESVGDKLTDLYKRSNNPKALDLAVSNITDSFNYKHNAEDAERRARAARENADKSLFGQIGNAVGTAGDWLGDRARDVSNAVSGTARNLYDTAGNAIGGVRDFIGDASRAAESFGRDLGAAASNAVTSAQNLISTAGGNLNQALNLATQRLRYAQNTGNPEMIREAQEVVRTLESPSFNFRDRVSGNTTLHENILPERTITENRTPERTINENRTSSGGGYFTYDPQTGQTVYVDKNGNVIRR